MDFNENEFRNENSSTTPDWNEETKDQLNRSSSETNSYRYENKNSVEKKGSGKKVFKSIVSTVAAGVVGSAITLTVLPYTGYLKSLNTSISNAQPAASVAPVSTSTVDAKPTAAATKSSESVADMVANVSKTIVGIENFQQQSNSNDPFGNNNNDSGISGFGNFGSFGEFWEF